ncbi:MAG: GTP-binding protein [Candidatus Thorarchaeota archaeon]
MLRQVYVYKNNVLAYSKKYGKVSEIDNLNTFLENLKNDMITNLTEKPHYENYKKYKFSLLYDKELSLLLLFINDITDDYNKIKNELLKCKNEIISLLKYELNEETKRNIDLLINKIQKALPPVLSFLGNKGVGKTELTNLIKLKKSTLKTDTYISADSVSLNLGGLFFNIRDFTGEEDFIFLWKNFIKDTNAAIIVTDSTLYDIEKAKLFLQLIKEENPNAFTGVIANKQDINNAFSIHQIEDIFGIKSYPMIATDYSNKEKLIEIFFEVMEMSEESILILNSFTRRERLKEQFKQALKEDKKDVANFLFEQIRKLTDFLGEDPEQIDFYNLEPALISSSPIAHSDNNFLENDLQGDKVENNLEDLPSTERKLKALLLNYMNSIEGIFATIICDRDGFIFTSERKKQIEDDLTLGALAVAVDSYIERIKREFDKETKFFNVTTVGNKKFSYCSVGTKSILATISNLSTTDTELRVYSEHIANKIELILDKKENVSLQIPDIIKVLAKTKDGKIPKGSFSNKLIITGDYLVGKTSLIVRFVQNLFKEQYHSTVGVDISQTKINLSKDTQIKFVIWDIGGQITQMAPYRKRFYEGANTVFIVIDRTRPESLKSVEMWIKDIKAHISSDVNIILIGNKSDLLNQILINEEEIKSVANKYNFNYILTSALTGENVDEAFLYAAYKFIENA